MNLQTPATPFALTEGATAAPQTGGHALIARSCLRRTIHTNGARAPAAQAGHAVWDAGGSTPTISGSGLSQASRCSRFSRSARISAESTTGRASGTLRLLSQLGPDARPILRAHLTTRDRAFRESLDCRHVLGRNRTLSRCHVGHERLRDTQVPRKRSSPSAFRLEPRVQLLHGQIISHGVITCQ